MGKVEFEDYLLLGLFFSQALLVTLGGLLHYWNWKYPSQINNIWHRMAYLYPVMPRIASSLVRHRVLFIIVPLIPLVGFVVALAFWLVVVLALALSILWLAFLLLRWGYRKFHILLQPHPQADFLLLRWGYRKFHILLQSNSQTEPSPANIIVVLAMPVMVALASFIIEIDPQNYHLSPTILVLLRLVAGVILGYTLWVAIGILRQAVKTYRQWVGQWRARGQHPAVTTSLSLFSFVGMVFIIILIIIAIMFIFLEIGLLTGNWFL